MLVHKATMGVLDQFWTGRYTQYKGESVPQMMEHTFATTDLPNDDWWEVPRMSALGKRLRLCYPFCEPVVDESGMLIDIVTPDAEPRTKTRKRRRSRKGLFEEILEE